MLTIFLSVSISLELMVNSTSLNKELKIVHEGLERILFQMRSFKKRKNQ